MSDELTESLSINVKKVEAPSNVLSNNLNNMLPDTRQIDRAILLITFLRGLGKSFRWIYFGLGLLNAWYAINNLFIVHDIAWGIVNVLLGIGSFVLFVQLSSYKGAQSHTQEQRTYRHVTQVDRSNSSSVA